MYPAHLYCGIICDSGALSHQMLSNLVSHTKQVAMQQLWALCHLILEVTLYMTNRWVDAGRTLDLNQAYPGKTNPPWYKIFWQNKWINWLIELSYMKPKLYTGHLQKQQSMTDRTKQLLVVQLRSRPWADLKLAVRYIAHPK